MNLKMCYQQLEGDYEDVMSRLPREEMVQRFIFKFLDEKSYDELNTAMQESDYETAFRAAHTIKGICQNLSLTKLYESSNRLTEALRFKKYQEAEELFNAFSEDYMQNISTIQAYKNALEG